jgi:hypothetical protein
MARSITEIKKQITDRWIAEPEVRNAYNLDNNKDFNEQFSPVSLESILFGAFATAAWILESLLDSHKKEVQDYITSSRLHTKQWYSNLAKSYLHGFAFNTESGEWETTGKSQEEIKTAQIVKFALCQNNGAGSLLIRVAKQQEDTYINLSPDEKNALLSYLNMVKDAGISLSINDADKESLTLKVRIYYNPTILNSKGERVDQTASTPVKDAINNYLSSLDNGGNMILNDLLDAIRSVEGVTALYFTQTPLIDGINSPQIYAPKKGYIRFNDNSSQLIYESI